MSFGTRVGHGMSGREMRRIVDRRMGRGFREWKTCIDYDIYDSISLGVKARLTFLPPIL